MVNRTMVNRTMVPRLVLSLVVLILLLEVVSARVISVPDTVITEVESVRFERGTVVIIGVERVPATGGAEPRSRAVVVRLSTGAARDVVYEMQGYFK